MRFIMVVLATALGSSAFANTAVTPIKVQDLALQKSYLQTIDCRAPQKITSLLSDALKDTNSYTAKASKASVFEEIIMQNPPCFVQAVNQLPEKACLQIKENFIEETFFYPRDDIKSALATAKNYPRSCLAS